MSSVPQYHPVSVPVEELDAVTVRLCGDSGDGMQLAGALLLRAGVRMGNAVCTMTDFPAEIRAPAGTLAGVSGYQVHFSRHPNSSPGDRLTALVAMNPAALLANGKDLEPNGLLIVNRDAFTPEELAKAGYSADPLTDGSLDGFRLFAIPMDRLNREAVAKLQLHPRDVDRSKNFFALGLVCWLFDRSLEPILKWNQNKFAANLAALQGNSRALKAGYRFAETSDLFETRYHVPKAPLPPGIYRHLTGTEGIILGLRTAARLAGRSLAFAGAPMTPACELLHQFLDHPHPDVRVMQAEDENAAVAMALGAAFGGAVAAVATSGPGLCQISEALGLAVMTELPLIVIDVQRCGPSIGLPTKTEQADLLQAMFGRNGESPVAVLAPSTPSDGFATTLEAVRIACRYTTPVVILSDVFLSGGAEPWRIPAADELPKFDPSIEPAPFQPYSRNEFESRPWTAPGTVGCEHRIGGLEKEDGTGAVSYDPANHEKMVQLRAAKIARIADEIPDLTVSDPSDGDLLVVGWGSTHGAISAAVQTAIHRGKSVAHAHFRHLNPLPPNTGEILRRYRRILVPELNGGQLLMLLRAKFLVDAVGLSKMQGRPFLAAEIEKAINELIQ